MNGLDWDLLTRYLAGACAPAEQERVERWLAESPANRAIVDDLRRAAALADETATPDRQAEILASLRRDWAGVADTDKQPAGDLGPGSLHLVGAERAAPKFAIPGSGWSAAAKIAAAVMLLVGGGVIAGRLLRHPPVAPATPRATFTAVATARGERRTLRLADGTLVALAPASTLRISSTYGARERAVELEGQAVFTVTHDSTRPFAVRTAHAVARDLGTRFAVRAYADEAATDVVVAEGLVAVSDRLVVHRGERARVGPEGRFALVRGVPLDEYFAWTEGRLVFQDTPLREAALQLGRWYAIDVRLGSQGIGARRLSASFRDEPTSEALRVVASVLNLEVSHTGSTYTLRAR